MNLRPLVLDDAFKAECQRLRDFAADPKNWYVLGDDMKPPFLPGDKPEYVLQTDFGYRVVLTITHVPTKKPKPFRHLSVSVPGDKAPHPIAVFTFAHHLGFTGATVTDDAVTEPGPWALAQDEDEGCIVVQQDYEIPNVS